MGVICHGKGTGCLQSAKGSVSWQHPTAKLLAPSVMSFNVVCCAARLRCCTRGPRSPHHSLSASRQRLLTHPAIPFPLALMTLRLVQAPPAQGLSCPRQLCCQQKRCLSHRPIQLPRAQLSLSRFPQRFLQQLAKATHLSRLLHEPCSQPTREPLFRRIHTPFQPLLLVLPQRH